MASVSQVANWRPVPNKIDTFIGQVSQAKAIHERLGARINVAQTQVGGEPMTLVYMMTFESGAAYGAFTAVTSSPMHTTLVLCCITMRMADIRTCR